MKDRIKTLPITMSLAVMLGFLAMLPFKHAAAGDPIKRALVFNTAETSNTDMFSSDFTQIATAPRSSAFRITIGIKTTNSVVSVIVKQGGTPLTFNLNDGTALTAGHLYTFVFGADKTCTFNMQCATSCTMGYLLVEEVTSDEL